IPATFLGTVLVITWPYARGTAGLWSSAFVALLSASMIALDEYTDIGRHTSMYLTVFSLGTLAGPPISGAINHHTAWYIRVGIFAGT
ncbi:hypothetical protein EI94DRAFT_1570226, partial [Lactarius quietus]